MVRLNHRKLLFSFALIPLAIASSGLTYKQHIPQSQQILAQSTNWLVSFWQRRPRKRLASRGTNNPICSISPGLVETYIVWSDRPLFLWHSPGNNQDDKLIVRDYETQEVVWQTPVKIADQKVVYGAEQPLEPGKLYQWQLSNSTNWVAFQVMPTSDRQKIQTDLQTLDQQLQATKTSPEEIALKKADYFLKQEITHTTESGIFHPWSDVFQVLYQVEKPSSSFIKQRETFVADVCKPLKSTTSQAQ